jgi:adenylate cyclase class IV
MNSTSKEIEIEIEVKNFKSIEEKLKKLGAKLEKQFSMRDVYFCKEKFYKNIRIRLRKLNNDEYLFTVKSPKFNSKGIQIAEEKETEGIDFKNKYKELFEVYGYPVIDEEIIVKRFILDSTIIELRKVKKLFNYVEISGKSIEDVNRLKEELNIRGRILKEGALNKVLELKKLSKID